MHRDEVENKLMSESSNDVDDVVFNDENSTEGNGRTGGQSFLKRKNIEFSFKRYAQDALSAMALGLFASLLIGLIIKTLGEQLTVYMGENNISIFLIDVGNKAMSMMGSAIGVSVAWALKAPPLVLFTSVVVGSMGATMTGFGINMQGGPAGAFIAVAVCVELGKVVSKETKLDIIVTPATALVSGAIAAKIIGPAVGFLIMKLGDLIMYATEWQPFFFGIFISVVVGLILTAPISSAALCIMMGLSGLAGGAATAGCCAQMVGFAVISFRDNGVGGLVAQGIGTSMLQVANIVKNPWILLPPTVAAAITGPMSTCIFNMTNTPMGSGMGTSGFVGQIGTFTDMGFSAEVLISVGILHFALPAVISLGVYAVLIKKGKIKTGDMCLHY